MKYKELKELVRLEIVQRREEGCDVTEAKKAFHRIKRKTPRRLEVILKILSGLEPVESFPYREPSDLPGIRAERLEGPRRIGLEISDEGVLDKIHGGWLGRCAGCLLGKPVEIWNKGQIETYLKLADAYPLKNYVPLVQKIPEESPEWITKRLNLLDQPGSWLDRRSFLGNIDRMVRDDDIDYVMLNLHILETAGLDFTTMDVGRAWLNNLCYLRFWRGVRTVYKNLINGLVPPETATYMNPRREWIGAQIRADLWGYVTPGMPELSAELAYRDASLSNVKNGIYGEMFVSAMISAAFTTNDIERIINIGLSEIPKQSRFAEAIRDVVVWSKEYGDWRDAWEKINEKYGHYHVAHTINNAALVPLGLLYGDGDYEKSIAISVMGGWDTDCNGATTGSTLGVILGAKNLPEKWIRPLNDRTESYVLGFNNSQISELAKRTFKLVMI